MSFIASKRHPSLYQLNGFIVLDLYEVRKWGKHQAGFDPEGHKVSRAMALLLWFSQFCPLLSALPSSQPLS